MSKTISDFQARRLLKPLYNVAEKDPSDIIANAASALAVKLERQRDVFVLSDLEVRIVQHALVNAEKFKTPEQTAPRRKTYKRREVSLA